MKTSELTGKTLDWAVAQCIDAGHWRKPEKFVDFYSKPSFCKFASDWGLAGEIIEREGVALYLYGDSEWNAHVGNKESKGSTPLIAAMRCYVASQLGDDVEIPEELTK